MIVYRSASDKLAVDSLVCMGKLGNARMFQGHPTAIFGKISVRKTI